MVEHGRSEQADSGVMMFLVIPVEEVDGEGFSVLDGAEEGLSLEPWGWLWILVTPRSLSRNATGLEVIEEPRSAWTVSWLGRMRCLRQVSSKSCLTRLALSR